MFDLGFSELLLIGVVALVVIGPERLPKVARTVGAWLGRLNRYVSDVKGDIDRELRLEELRKMQQDMKDTAQKYEILADETGREIQREVDGVGKAMQPMAATDGGSATQAYTEDLENATPRLVSSAETSEAISSDTPAESVPDAPREDMRADVPSESPAPADRPANAA